MPRGTSNEVILKGGRWASTPETYRSDFIHFLKNLAIMGGLLLVLGQAKGKQ